MHRYILCTVTKKNSSIPTQDLGYWSSVKRQFTHSFIALNCKDTSQTTYCHQNPEPGRAKCASVYASRYVSSDSACEGVWSFYEEQTPVMSRTPKSCANQDAWAFVKPRRPKRDYPHLCIAPLAYRLQFEMSASAIRKTTKYLHI